VALLACGVLTAAPALGSAGQDGFRRFRERPTQLPEQSGLQASVLLQLQGSPFATSRHSVSDTRHASEMCVLGSVYEEPRSDGYIDDINIAYMGFRRDHPRRPTLERMPLAAHPP